MTELSTITNTELSVDKSDGPAGKQEASHLIWWKNAPFLYDILLNQRLDWPATTVDSLTQPLHMRIKGGSCLGGQYCVQRFIFGTSTSDQEPAYIHLAELKYPLVNSFKEDPLRCETYAGFLPPKNRARLQNAFISNLPSFEIKAKILHPGDVNKTCCMPQNEFFIASQTCNGNVLFFDYAKHPSVPIDTVYSRPQLVMQGHAGEGYGLCWNTGKSGILASCGEDGKAAIWDINSGGMKYKSATQPANLIKEDLACSSLGTSSSIFPGTATISPLYMWSGTKNNEPINDIAFHPKFSSVSFTAGDDGAMKVWDLRTPSNPSQYANQALSQSLTKINSISPNLHSEFIVASGDIAGEISIWDLRNLNLPLRSLKYHTGAINRLQFSPISASFLGAASDDGSLSIWDLARTNDTSINTCKFSNHTSHTTVENYKISQTAHLTGSVNDMKERHSSNTSLPELAFVHKGHKGGLTDFSWCIGCWTSLLIFSVAWDNALQCWQVSDQILLNQV